VIDRQQVCFLNHCLRDSTRPDKLNARRFVEMCI